VLPKTAPAFRYPSLASLPMTRVDSPRPREPSKRYSALYIHLSSFLGGTSIGSTSGRALQRQTR
jgi:hypothetical protein